METESMSEREPAPSRRERHSLRAHDAPVLRMKPLADASRAVEVSLIWMMRVTSLSAWMAT